jgi:hypothetical protein
LEDLIRRIVFVRGQLSCGGGAAGGDAFADETSSF